MRDFPGKIAGVGILHFDKQRSAHHVIVDFLCGMGIDIDARAVESLRLCVSRAHKAEQKEGN
jgi:hypothetical protein